MVEKIYDKVGSVQEINGIAADLRRIGLREEIKILAEKNKIPTGDIEDYLKGKRYFLVDGGNAKTYETVRSKLLDEMGFLNDPQFGDVIGRYLLENCGDSEFSRRVLQNHKTLQRCIEHLMKKAREMVTDEESKRPQKTCVAVGEDMVYQWANEYYELDDAEEAAKAVQEEDKRFLARNAPKPLVSKSGKKSSSAKRTGKKKTAPSEPVSQKEDAIKAVTEKRALKEDRDQIEGQVSLF